MTTTKLVSRLVAALALGTTASAAMAVGDLPRKLDRRQAAAVYTGVRPLLTNDAIGCPRGQVPVSGLVKGGSSPGSGSQTTTIAFDKGATVTILRQWYRGGGSAVTASTTITCS